MTRQEKKESITKQRRQQILDAALSVFPRKGFDKATIPDIAQAAGVAVGTIYNYYQSKHDLLISLIGSYIMNEPLISLLEHPPESEDATFLSSLVENRLNLAFGNIDVLILLMTEIQRDPELCKQYVERVVSPVLKLVEKYLESKATQGAFRPLNTGVVTRAFAAMMIGLGILHLIEGEKGLLRRIPRQELASEVANLILGGIQQR